MSYEKYKTNIHLFSGTLWDKLEEIEPESWDEFTDLFSRQVVAAKPVKPKAESKPVKQQTVKSNHFFSSHFLSCFTTVFIILFVMFKLNSFR